VASLEGATHGLAFGSGLAALDAVLKLLKSGDHIVCGENVYGGSHRLMERIYGNFGLQATFVDMRDVGNIERAITPATRLIYCETPTNPMMNLTDLAGVGDLAQAHGYLYVVDNTFATPYFQRPFEYGADIVWHSTTKYLNGHSDMIGGIAAVQDDELGARLQFIQNAAGAVPGPFDSWLALRGTKTLHLRMAAHDRNGRQVAAWLAERLGDERVIYPGLRSHPQHELACRQMTGMGGMISVELGTKERAAQVLGRVRVFSLAESLGGVESLISHPASMTHASVPPDRRAQLGITEGMVRLSCGVEDVGDLLNDVERAFEGM
jgi:cystathionine beta-lyase/cystathionine gamma-synthase